MRIRELDIKDAPLMYSWMHDDNVVDYLLWRNVCLVLLPTF